MLICHIITGLNDGGAEAVLYRLCKHDASNQHQVVSLSGYGKYGPMLEALGVSVTTLNMSSWRPSPLAFIRLVRLLRREEPDFVQTWMYHADLFGGLAARTAGIKNVVWGIRQTILEPGTSKKKTIWIAGVLATLSWRLPAKIIVCAQRAMDVHEELGYDRTKMRFIPNGYDLAEFQPSRDPQGYFRAILNVSTTSPLIGVVGRFDPYKDHLNLLDALVILRNRGISFQCLFVGSGLDQSNSKLVASIAERGLAGSLLLLGQRADIPKIMNALDVFVLPSYAEAFPNVVAEAMACETPCVVTDVGDTAYIVGDTGWVVPPRSSERLADAIEVALNELGSQAYAERRTAARKRIEENFDIDIMVRRYNDIWQETKRL
jgi:glycosyltransferase involved in cell wall biosynthesis